MRHGVFGAQHDGTQVDLVLTLPVLDRVLFDEGQGAADAGAVDQDRQTAQVGRSGVDHAGPVVLASDVVGVGEGGAGGLDVDAPGQVRHPAACPARRSGGISRTRMHSSGR